MLGLALFVGFYELDDLIGGSGTASRVVAEIVLFIVVVAVGNVGVIRSELQRKERRRRHTQ